MLRLNPSEEWRSSMMILVPRVPSAAKGRSRFNTGRNVCLLALVLPAGLFLAALPSVGSSLAAEPITPIPVPAQLDMRRVTLGEQLFHDPRLSHDNTQSCGSCHDTDTNGASAKAQDRGAHGSLLPFNTPTVFSTRR
jgi:cytochrome c peroxidase